MFQKASKLILKYPICFVLFFPLIIRIPFLFVLDFTDPGSDSIFYEIANNHEKFEVSNFVFASDFQNDNKKTYEQAINFATIFNSRIDLLMVNTASKFTTTKEALKKINKFVENYNYPNQTINIYNDESVEQGILNFSKDINADLIGAVLPASLSASQSPDSMLDSGSMPR